MTVSDGERKLFYNVGTVDTGSNSTHAAPPLSFFENNKLLAQHHDMTLIQLQATTRWESVDSVDCVSSVNACHFHPAAASDQLCTSVSSVEILLKITLLS